MTSVTDLDTGAVYDVVADAQLGVIVRVLAKSRGGEVRLRVRE